MQTIFAVTYSEGPIHSYIGCRSDVIAVALIPRRIPAYDLGICAFTEVEAVPPII